MMKNLKSISTYVYPDWQDMLDCYQYNKELVGDIFIDRKIYQEYVKLLTIFPLSEKKLKYFLKLSALDKAGYMSRYLIKIAKNIGIPQIYIENYHREKRSCKSKYNPDKKFIRMNKLHRETYNLCQAIFEFYDEFNKK